MAAYNILCERVITINVALHEVGKVELRRRLDGERHGLQVARDDEAGVRVGV